MPEGLCNHVQLLRVLRIFPYSAQRVRRSGLLYSGYRAGRRPGFSEGNFHPENRFMPGGRIF
jgi:hypothetical protein